MKLYFSPLACSLASRIVAYDAGIPLDLVEVGPLTKRTPDGTDYRTIHPLGLVPALALDSGEVITENTAILQYLGAADAPTEPLGRARLQQWLNFISTELHKAVFVPLLDKHAPEAVKQYALGKADARLGHLAAHLAGRDHLLDRFSVADAYLVAVLNWAQVTPVALAKWPSLVAYLAWVKQRPSVARALAEELPMYVRERERHAKTA